MRTRDRIGLTLPSFLLRLVLGITFIWAGLGKLQPKLYTPEQAATLARLGVAVPATPTLTPPPSPALPAEPPATPQPEPVETDDPDDEWGNTSDEPAQPDEPLPDTTPPPAGSDEQSPAPYHWLPVQSTQALPSAALTAADFPNGVNARKLYGLAMLIDNAAHPKLDNQSQPVRSIWPGALADRPWPTILAWAVALTELLAGALLILGLFTRLSALGLVCVMGGAIWLTQFGSAIQAGNTQLGFLPAHATFDIAAWKDLGWQLALFAMSWAVFLLGSGPIGIDHALFRPRKTLFEQPPPRRIHRTHDESIP